MGTGTFFSSSKWNRDAGLQNQDAHHTAFTSGDRGTRQGALRWALRLRVAKTFLRTQDWSQRCASLSKRPAKKIWRWVHLTTQWFLYSLFNKCLFIFFLSVWKSFTWTLIWLMFICRNFRAHTEDAALQDLSRHSIRPKAPVGITALSPAFPLRAMLSLLFAYYCPEPISKPAGTDV